jgi:PAS domain S-box-containing protein
MSEHPKPERNSAEPRERTETHRENAPLKAGDQTSDVQSQCLLHELQVYQVELERQNEQLRESRTQAEAALERYTELYDFAPVGYLSLSVDGTILEVNLPGARLMGLERSRLVGARFGVFVSPETLPIFDSWFKNVCTAGTKQRCEVVLLREGLTPATVEIEAALSTDGSAARVVAVDITARKVLEEQLRQAHKMEVLGQLAGGVAHDSNNILAAMMLNLGVLQMQHLPKEALEPLQNLEVLTARAANLARQLLLFSRRQAMKPERMEVKAALTNLFKMIERLLGDGLTYHWLLGAQPLWVECDAAMFDQAVMNLCLNARDAMPNGGTLTFEATLAEFNTENINLHPERRTGRFVCVRISDTGHGMDAEVLQHLFEPFFTTKELGKGTGLGLASAYGIVHEHRGWLEVESTLQRGSTFRIYFPLSEKGERAPTANPPIWSSCGRNETILVVDDDVALLHLIEKVLTSLNYKVLPAADGHEALILWNQHRDTIDLLLTDVTMPRGISGIQLAENLSRTKPSLRIIIMSGNSADIAGSDEISRGARHAFLAKPFTFETLVGMIRSCLDQSAPILRRPWLPRRHRRRE